MTGVEVEVDIRRERHRPGAGIRHGVAGHDARHTFEGHQFPVDDVVAVQCRARHRNSPGIVQRTGAGNHDSRHGVDNRGAYQGERPGDIEIRGKLERSRLVDEIHIDGVVLQDEIALVDDPAIPIKRAESLGPIQVDRPARQRQFAVDEVGIIANTQTQRALVDERSTDHAVVEHDFALVGDDRGPFDRTRDAIADKHGTVGQQGEIGLEIDRRAIADFQRGATAEGQVSTMLQRGVNQPHRTVDDDRARIRERIRCAPVRSENERRGRGDRNGSARNVVERAINELGTACDRERRRVRQHTALDIETPRAPCQGDLTFIGQAVGDS